MTWFYHSTKQAFRCMIKYPKSKYWATKVQPLCNACIMNKTTDTENFEESHTPLEIFFMVIFSSVFILHICNIIVIKTQCRLQQACRWLLISLSVSDMVQLLVNLVCQINLIIHSRISTKFGNVTSNLRNSKTHGEKAFWNLVRLWFVVSQQKQ